DGGGNPVPVAFQIGKQFGDLHAVYPSRTLIPHYLPVGFVEVLSVEYFFYHNKSVNPARLRWGCANVALPIEFGRNPMFSPSLPSETSVDLTARFRKLL